MKYYSISFANTCKRNYYYFDMSFFVGFTNSPLEGFCLKSPLFCPCFQSTCPIAELLTRLGPNLLRKNILSVDFPHMEHPTHWTEEDLEKKMHLVTQEQQTTTHTTHRHHKLKDWIGIEADSVKCCSKKLWDIRF